MAESFDVREVSEAARVIDISGDVTAQSEDVLMAAYDGADSEGVTAVVLNFSALDYMNSGGIGLLVMLLVRAQRKGQKVLAFGLSEHYRQIFELTRLDEAIGIYDTQDDALAAWVQQARTFDEQHARRAHRGKERSVGDPSRQGAEHEPEHRHYDAQLPQPARGVGQT
jgi:anti-sigma B factor antagonist